MKPCTVWSKQSGTFAKTVHQLPGVPVAVPGDRDRIAIAEDQLVELPAVRVDLVERDLSEAGHGFSFTDGGGASASSSARPHCSATRSTSKTVCALIICTSRSDALQLVVEEVHAGAAAVDHVAHHARGASRTTCASVRRSWIWSSRRELAAAARVVRSIARDRAQHGLGRARRRRARWRGGSAPTPAGSAACACRTARARGRGAGTARRRAAPRRARESRR